LKDTTLEELTEFLIEKSHYTLTEKKAMQILDTVESDGNTELLEYQYVRNFLVENIVKEVKFIEEEVAKVDIEIKAIVDKLGYKLHTMNGIDIVTAARLIAEIGDISRFPTPDKLAKYSAVAPITYSSGQKDKQLKNKQGNRTLYGIFHLLAIQQIVLGRNTNNPRNPVFRQYYEKKISEGKTSGQAIIFVARRLVNIIWGMMKNKTEYRMPEMEYTPTILPSKKANSNTSKRNPLQQNGKRSNQNKSNPLQRNANPNKSNLFQQNTK